MTCAQRLIQLLEAYGVDTAFGIPGVHTIELYRALGESRLRHVTPRHEQGAGFMADGHARASGKPAACFIITGPGMTNIATAMGQALADSVPMLVISSVNQRASLGRGQGRLHEMPHQRETLAGVSVFSHTLHDPEALPEVLARAFAIFDSARPGPVHIEIPLDVMGAPVSDAPVTPTRSYPPAPAPEALRQAAEWLAPRFGRWYCSAAAPSMLRTSPASWSSGSTPRRLPPSTPRAYWGSTIRWIWRHRQPARRPPAGPRRRRGAGHRHGAWRDRL